MRAEGVGVGDWIEALEVDGVQLIRQDSGFSSSLSLLEEMKDRVNVILRL